MSTPQNPELEQKLKEVRELYADAPEIARVALENAIQNMTTEAHPTPAGSAGRIGRRQGAVSELTIIVPFAEGGAKRLRGVLELLNGNFDGAEKVGTVHDMRFVFLDNDSKLLFATAYDGDWDPYRRLRHEDPGLYGHSVHLLRGMAGNPQPRSEGFYRSAPIAGERLVCRQPGSDRCGSEAAAEGR